MSSGIPAPNATYPLDSLDTIAIGSTLPSFTPGVSGAGQLYGASRNTLYGSLAGQHARDSVEATYIGYGAGAQIAHDFGSVFIGAGAGTGATGSDRNIGIGPGSLASVQGLLRNTGAIQGSFNVAIGESTLGVLTTAYSNVAIGSSAGLSIIDGPHNTMIGESAGAALVHATASVCLGEGAGNSGSGDHSYMALLGSQTAGGGDGAVAIGSDHTGTGASAAAQDYFVLGTVNHKLFIPGLPSADPHVSGQLWNNAGVVTVSAG